MLAAHVATLNQSPHNPIPNKENSCGTIRDFSFAQAMGHRVIRNAALWLATTLQLSCRDRNSPYRPANHLQALRVCCREACDCCRPGIAGCNRRKLQRVPGPLSRSLCRVELYAIYFGTLTYGSFISKSLGRFICTCFSLKLKYSKSTPPPSPSPTSHFLYLVFVQRKLSMFYVENAQKK